MIMRLVLPRYEKVHFLSGICSLFLRKEDEVHYIGGAEILPPPLEGEREAYCIRMLDGVHAERAEAER
jgi:RNA polymerase sporulation-specific sigma factor